MVDQGGHGVRAEPVFIRDPSALESLSSVLTGVSSYVANTLPASFSLPARGFTTPSGTGNHHSPSPVHPLQTSPGHPQENIGVLASGDVVLFSAFDWMETTSSVKGKPARRFCLLLGYMDGFQIWDITHPDNIHEIISIRQPQEGEVSFLKVLPAPKSAGGRIDQFEQYRPLVAYISATREDGVDELAGGGGARQLKIYSLRTHQVVKTFDYGDPSVHEITAVDANERCLVVGVTSGGSSTRLHVYSQLTLSPIHPKLSVLADASSPGIFMLGSRLLAYVTTQEAAVESGDGKKNGEDPDGSNGYQDIAKGVAKEVLGGVKLLGGFAHQTISSYWSNGSSPGSTGHPSTSPPAPSTMTKTLQRQSRRSSSFIDHERTGQSSSTPRRKADDGAHRREAVGTIIIRDVTLPNMPIVTHFKPHDHPISGIKFSPSGRLLLSVSRQGNVFHVHELRPSGTPVTRHLYKLARGITHANVEDIIFNEEETWVGVTTSRGTTHLYAINPFGGSPDVGAHMYTGVINWTAITIEYPTSLNAVCRIKQRHHIPDFIIGATGADDVGSRIGNTYIGRQSTPDSQRSATLGYDQGRNGQPSISGSGQSTYPSSLELSAKYRSSIATHFLPSLTIFATDPNSIPMSPGTEEDSTLQDGLLDGRDSSSAGAQTSSAATSFVLNRSKAPPVSTAARLQSTASHLWQTLSPPAATIVQHAAHGLASIPSLVVEGSRRGAVSTARSRTLSWAGGSNANSNTSKLNHATKESQDGHQVHGIGIHSRQSHQRSQASRLDGEIPSYSSSAPQATESERGPAFQDIYVFNPLGMLTLHRCWITSTKSKRTYNGRVVETLELVLAPEDVAEWTLNRGSDWAPVKRSLMSSSSTPQRSSLTMPPLRSNKSPIRGSNAASGAAAAVTNSRWLAHAEITTYDNGIHSGWRGHYPLLSQSSANGTSGGQSGGAHSTQYAGLTMMLIQPQHLLWKSPQFTFQTYVDSAAQAQHQLIEGQMPATRTLDFRRGITIVPGGKDGSNNRGSQYTDLDTLGRPFVSGIAVAADGRGVKDHGRVESHEGDAEDLSENLSQAMKSYLQMHSSSPIQDHFHRHQHSKMSPTVSSISPSSSSARGAATLSFEDAYQINLLGNGSSVGGSPSPASFFNASNGNYNRNSHHGTPQHTFMATPPADEVPPLGSNRYHRGSFQASRPLSHVSVQPSSNHSSPPMIGDSMVLQGPNGSQLRSSARTTSEIGATMASNAYDPFSPVPPSQPSASTVPMHIQQEVLMSESIMFSPDGDNEVDMPGSASVMFIPIKQQQQQAYQNRHSPSAAAPPGSTQAPLSGDQDQDGIFHLDDDDDFFEVSRQP
ncbi:Breast carcinoma amplified sequence 3 [Actinomortierella ambigua]|uniref:Breast carcinoma amplified sequence 3 n=1 Tax=Actinomortierella ambigua TaxID=1343610 RepID=A0A9P6QKD2_9FUNG|nr:Breast carcinoma amplified sequence 3 [Actinomortierella ambigua]